MDTWNTSSLTPYICKQLYRNNDASPFADTDFIPMSMRPQAHDIIRTWAFYTIVKSWMHQKEIPWNDIVISGYVLSENKEKISKSKDNAPTDPEKLLTQYAPDAVRFWTACGTLGQDIAFSPEQIQIGQKLLTKLWNALKFVHMNIENQDVPKIPVSAIAKGDGWRSENIGIINQWMIDQMQVALSSYHAYLQKHEFSLALASVEKVFWNDFCDNYIEIIKDQFFSPANYSPEEIQATRYTLQQTGFMFLQLYAPYLPHITEYLYQHIFLQTFGVSSIHLTQLPEALSIHHDNQENMQLILHVIAQVRKLKTSQQLSLKTELTSLIISNATQDDIKVLKQQENILKGVCKATKIIFSAQKHEPGLMQEGDTWRASVTAEQE